MQYSPSAFPKTFDVSLLIDKSILITGGASGLGAAFARRFAEAGAFVTIADLNQDAGKALEAELMQTSKLGVKFVHCDVTDWKSQVQAFKTAISSSPTKTLDTVIAAAGIPGSQFDTTPASSRDNPDEDPPEPITTCLKVNLFGVYYTTQAALHYMGKSSTPPGQDGIFGKQSSASEMSQFLSKSVILVGSLAGYHAVLGAVEYSAAKYGVRGILKSLRTETEEVGVRLNIIAPTYIVTPLLSHEAVAALTAAGVQFAEIETAVQAVGVLATHGGIHGRAICVGANGNLDLRDDQEGLNAGLMLQAYAKEMEEKREKAGIKGSERFFYL